MTGVDANVIVRPVSGCFGNPIQWKMEMTAVSQARLATTLV